MEAATHRTSIRPVLRKRFIVIFFGTVSLVILLWMTIEWDIRRLENAVWDRSDFSGLKKQEKLLDWVYENRMTPARLRGRVSGLRGDLAYHRGHFEEAFQLYAIAINPFQKKGDLLNVIENSIVSFSDFSKGYSAYSESVPIISPLNDEEMELVLAEIPDSKNARFAYSKIPGLSPEDVKLVRNLLYDARKGNPNMTAIRELCGSNRSRIKSLILMQQKFSMADNGDLSNMSKSADFIRLLALDALSQMKAGHSEKAKESFDAAYKIIGFLEQIPMLASGLEYVAIRDRLVDLMDSEFGRPLGSLFTKNHLMMDDPYDWFIRGTYHSQKKILTDAMAGTSPVEQRLRQLVLEKNLNFYRAVRESDENSRAGGGFYGVQAEWYFRNRRFIYRRTSATYAEGGRFAAQVEDMVAEIVHWTGVPNLGRFEDSLDATKEAELKILNGNPTSE